MRSSRDGSFIISNSGNVQGINLGADYCSEHEWGIADIKTYLKVDDKANYGLARRKVGVEPRNLHWYETDKYVGFVLYQFFHKVDNWKPHETNFCDKEKKFIAGWSRDGFYVLADKVVKDKKILNKTIEKLKTIYNALQNNNACIWLGGGGVFQNAGLCIGVVDKMPKDIFEAWYKSDKERDDVKKQFDDTGIEEFLRKAGKKWFFLGPKMVNGKMLIWLNPYEQHIHNAGYFTVKQLKEWAENKGPVMMKGKR